MNLDFNIDLINFINQEKTNKNIHIKKCFKYFNSCLIKSFIELNNKFNQIDNKNKNIICGINMIYHIYFLLINYSNNIKLTIFLLERAILLYTEFIIMSQDKKIIDDICFIPNTNDAVSFAFKKTIGPLKINTLIKTKKNIKNIKLLSLILKNIYIQKFLDKSNNVNNDINNDLNNDLNNELTKISVDLENELFNLFDKNIYIDYIFTKIKYILETNNNIDIKIEKIKYFC